MNPKLFWLITALLLVPFHRAEAQQPAKIPRIGFLGAPPPRFAISECIEASRLPEPQA